MSGFIPPKNLSLGTCAACQCNQCAEIPPGEFSELLDAVKDRFEDLPVGEEAAEFVADWVAARYPEGAPALLSVAFLRRYMDLALDVLCGNREI